MTTQETTHSLVLALESLHQILSQPKEKAQAHQWVRAKIQIEEAVIALVSSSDPPTNQTIDQGLKPERLTPAGSYNLIERLAESIQIDPRLTYRSRDEGEGLRKSSPEEKEGLVGDEFGATGVLGLQIQSISHLVHLINLISPSPNQNQEQNHREAEHQHSVNTSGQVGASNVLHAIGVSFHAISGLIFRLSAWCSVGHSIDEWVLDLELENHIQSLITKLWQLVPSLDLTNPSIQDYHGHKSYKKKHELEYGYIVLNDYIKPFFMKQDSFSNQIDLKTGRTKHRHRHHHHQQQQQYGNNDLSQDHLFGPTFNSSVDIFNNQLWKIRAIGFWNSVCLLLDRLHQEPGIIEIWALLIPPIITLLEETHSRYRLRGIQLSISLLKNAPPHQICQTGINDLLQKGYSNTFGLLNMQETHELLNASFEGNILLIQVEWNASSNKGSKDQARRRYFKINQLFHESIANPLVFRKSHGEILSGYELHLLHFVVTSVAQLAELLHFAIGRYVQMIVPYLIESLLKLKELNLGNYRLVVKINKLIRLLFVECPEVLEEWRARLVVVFASCWLEWQACPDDNLAGKIARSSAQRPSEKQDRLDQSQLESVKLSIIQDVFESFLATVKHPQAHPSCLSSSANVTNQTHCQHLADTHIVPQQPQAHQGEKNHESHQLGHLIRSICNHHPALSELLTPFL